MVWERTFKLAVILAPMVIVEVAGLSHERAQPLAWALRRAEASSASLGLVWGKLRAFAREDQAWRLFYQPAHGAWVVTVKVSDAGEVAKPSLEAAPWLPGSKLSPGAVQWLTGEEPLGFVEGPRRRDWRTPGGTVVGSLFVGTTKARSVLPAKAAWPVGVAVGLLLAGAVGRRLRPHPRAPEVRRAIAALSAVLALGGIGFSRLAWPLFVPGIRPFVSLLQFQAFWTLVLGVVAVSAFAVPPLARKPQWWPWGLGFSSGWILGVLSSPTWAVALAASPGRWFFLVAGAVVLGFVADLMGTGGRLLLAPLSAYAPWVALGLAGVSLVVSGWGLALACLLLVAACPPGQSLWFAMAFAGGFLPGAWWAGVGWWGPLRDGFLLSLVVWAVLTAWAMTSEPTSQGNVTIAGWE